MLHRLGRLCFVAIVLAIWGLFLAGFVMLLTYVPQALRSRTWPSVVGHVLDSQPAHYGRGSILHVEYEFQVDGVSYVSSRYRFSPKNGPSSGEAQAGDYAPGTAVTVFYDASNPNQCVIRPGVYAGDSFCIAFFAAVIALQVFILWGALRGARAKHRTGMSAAAML